jgi:hypothetical protein
MNRIILVDSEFIECVFDWYVDHVDIITSEF